MVKMKLSEFLISLPKISKLPQPINFNQQRAQAKRVKEFSYVKFSSNGELKEERQTG